MSTERFISDRLKSRKGGFSLDTAALAKYNDVIDLSIGDTNLTTDSRVINAAFEDALKGYTHYGDPKGDPELIKAIIDSWEDDFSERLQKDEVLITASAGIGLSAALSAITNPGDEIIVFAPYYPNYTPAISLSGGVLKEVALYASEGFALSEERLRAAITDRTKAILFNNPVNPSGMLYEEDACRIIAKIAQDYDLVVIADEIYTAYIYEGTYVPMRTLPNMKERTITLTSFSKNYQMTGWRVGAAIADPAIINAMFSYNAPSIYTTPSISQRAAIKALSLKDELCPMYMKAFKERIDYSVERAKNIPWISLIKPKGTFYLFPNIEKTGLSSVDFCSYLLDNAHILVSPGSVFGSTGEGHVRIAVSCADISSLKEAFDRMDKLQF